MKTINGRVQRRRNQSVLCTHHTAAGRMQDQAAAGLDSAQLEQQHVGHDVVGGQGRGIHVVQAFRYGEHVLGRHGHELGPRAPFGQRYDTVADLQRKQKYNAVKQSYYSTDV